MPEQRHQSAACLPFPCYGDRHPAVACDNNLSLGRTRIREQAESGNKATHVDHELSIYFGAHALHRVGGPFAWLGDGADGARSCPLVFYRCRLLSYRSVAHRCSPVFHPLGHPFLCTRLCLSGGTSAFLSATRGLPRPQLARRLFTRGLWLVFLEVTAVRLAWVFNLDYSQLGLGVIWALGWSMVALAALVYLPRWAIACAGIGMIVAHNLLDGLQLDSFRAARRLAAMAGMAAERAPRARLPHLVSADSMDWRHGGRVCLRAHPPDAARPEATIAACMGNGDHRGLRPLAPL